MIVKTKKVIITGVKPMETKNGDQVTKVFVREPDGRRVSFLDSNPEHKYRTGKAHLILSMHRDKEYNWHMSIIGADMVEADKDKEPEVTAQEA